MSREPTEAEAAGAERDARELIRAQLAGDRQAATAIVSRADLPVLADLLSQLAVHLFQQAWRQDGMTDETEIAIRIDEGLRGVASPAAPESARLPDLDTMARTAAALIVAVGAGDKWTAEAILNTCSRQETADVALSLARLVVGIFEPEDRPEVLDGLAERLRAVQDL